MSVRLGGPVWPAAFFILMPRAATFQVHSERTASAQRAVERRRSAQREGVRSNGWLGWALPCAAMTFLAAPAGADTLIEGALCFLRAAKAAEPSLGKCLSSTAFPTSI